MVIDGCGQVYQRPVEAPAWMHTQGAMHQPMHSGSIRRRRVRLVLLARVPFDMMPLDIPATKLTEPVTRRAGPARATDAAGDAFESAFDENWLAVFRFALAWTNDWAAAEDLAQDSFLRLWDRRHEIDWTRPVLPWLLVATRRRATDRFRRIRRALNPRETGAAPIDSDARLEWLDLSAGFATLSALERTALVLTALLDMEAAAAGEVLGIGANAVRSAASRGRRKLKERR